MTNEPLLLAAREFARGSLASLPLDFEIVASVTSSTHFAILFRSQTERDCVRLGVFEIDEDNDVENCELVDIRAATDDFEVSQSENDNWTLVWSPDLRFLVISGRISHTQGASEGVMWIFARSKWLVPEEAADHSTANPLLLCIKPSMYLAAKHWNPATNIVNVFFPTHNGSKAFVLSEDGVWLAVNIQLAKLSLDAMNSKLVANKVKFITMKMVKKLTEWHADISAACYDPTNSTLVISGGVINPSTDLIEKQAASLSVWKVLVDKDNKEVCELLDFTMLLKGKMQHKDVNVNNKSDTDMMSSISEERNGLLSSIKNSLYAPLIMMIGGETRETRILRGWIHQLALAPNGNFVSMVDDLGRIAIRQIDVCTDVLMWQSIENLCVNNMEDPKIKIVVWLTSDLLALVLTNNTIVYSCFVVHPDEEAELTSNVIEDESLKPSGRLLPVRVKHYRPGMSEDHIETQTLAVDVYANLMSSQRSVANNACEFVSNGHLWAANQIDTMEAESFIEMLMNARKFEDALATVEFYNLSEISINPDKIHRRLWTNFREQAGRLYEENKNVTTHSQRSNLVFLSTRPRGSLQRGHRSEFLKALDHLRAISDKRWVLRECMTLIADDSCASMKKILDVAWDAWFSLNVDAGDNSELSQEQKKLQRDSYRLETLRLLLCEEEGVPSTSVTGDLLFDGMTYVRFKVSSILSTAQQFASEGRVCALTILFQRHGENLLPHWLKILRLIPPSVSPSTYSLLLPAITDKMEDDVEFCTLSRIDELIVINSDEDYDLITPFPFSSENRLQDLSSEELSAYSEFIEIPREERNAGCGQWFIDRIKELDERFGQLAFAFELGDLALQCLRGWSALKTKKVLEELVFQTERLYKCVYRLHLSACCLLPLSDWSALSLQDQAMIVVGIDDIKKIDDIGPLIDRLDVVFKSQRGSQIFSLDDLFVSIAITLASKASLIGLTIAAQLIQQSNPSVGLANRWIQSEARLIETALGVINAVTVSDLISSEALSADTNAYMRYHQAFAKQLWIIFQSLPSRSEHDPPEIAQLQVVVDETEDLMVTMDVLSKYDVVAFPSTIKSQILVASNDSGGIDKDGEPLALLKQMCKFALPGTTGQWLEVLQDAIQLKEHVFGERLSQNKIMEAILKHLLAPGHVDVDAAQNLVNYWIASDVKAIDYILEQLLVTLRVALDSVVGYSEDSDANAAHKAALCIITITKQLLALSLWDDGDKAAIGTKQHYENMLRQETDVACACELLDLLTYGAVKLSPSKLRAVDTEEQKKIRLDAVCQVFVSNPSNYKPSKRAKEWLAQHQIGNSIIAETDYLKDEPLAAVMHLAQLLRVETQKLEIWLKGAYASLYCMDYDVACNLTLQVINEMAVEVGVVVASNNSKDSQLTHLQLISLVLDLVSAASFGSWSKKRQLCLALLSATTVSSLHLFAHQATDLVLHWLEKIEAIQALMIELGLSERDLEQRRLDVGKGTISVAVVLLNELKVVVDLLHEENNDRQFLLGLVQRGFQLTQVILKDAGNAEQEAYSTSVSSFLQQIIQLSVEETVELTTSASNSKTGDWQLYIDLAFNHLMLWSDLCTDDATFEAFCANILLSLTPTQDTTLDSSETNEVVVRRFCHFFLLQAAREKAFTLETDDEVTEISRRLRLQTLISSYDAAHKAVRFTGEPSSGVSESINVAQQSTNSELLLSDRRYHIYLKLAQKCYELSVSQKSTQEMDRLRTILNSDFDSVRFLQDKRYRNERILSLATKKEHYHLSRQLANKYGLDEFECVLTYIKHALLSPSDDRRKSRRKQLDEAFAIDQVDILEEALKRPRLFGDFLLKKETIDEPSLYEALDGTDHVGVLLVLRMILECSKRLDQETTEFVRTQEHSLFPLPKSSIDRITLLVLCLKKLKDISDSVKNVDAVDLKLIGAASTSTELLTPPTSSQGIAIANRKVAIKAVQPLLTNKSIKLVTKVLRKLHYVTPSAMVMIYINNLLTNIWKEHGNTGNSLGALSADLAVYAYESCVPCLSVLSGEHLTLFHHLYLNRSSDKSLPKFLTHLDIDEEFYGQRLDSVSLFGSLLTPQKRVELEVDMLTILQTKYNSWQNSGLHSNVSSASSTSSTSSVSWDPAQFKRLESSVHYMERELAENVCYWVLSEIEKSGMTSEADEFTAETSLMQPMVQITKEWFAMDHEQLREDNDEDFYIPFLLKLCQHIACVELASLIMELMLRFGIQKTSSEESTKIISQMYQRVVVSLIQRCVGLNDDKAHESADWVEKLMWTWVVGSCSPISSQKAELESFLEKIFCLQASARVIYERVLKILSQSTSNLLKDIGMRRLQELHIASDENANQLNAARQAIKFQWEESIVQYQEKRKWAEAAVLSHVYANSVNMDAAKFYFGLRVKAVWAALLNKYNADVNQTGQFVFRTPSGEIFDRFADMFNELLTIIEAWSGDVRPANMATVALSHLLVIHDDLKVCNSSESTTQRSVLMWQREQEIGVRTRIQMQFRSGYVIEKEASKSLVATCWSALVARGKWGDNLLDWYTTHAYAELVGHEEIMDFVISKHLESNNLTLAIQLLMMCPFDELRKKYMDRALAYVRQLSQKSHSWPKLMELVLLRFDIAVLLQHDLYTSIVAFVLQDACTRPTLWTSSGNYIVCALVTLGEVAAAGRLTCALRHAHPMLWDMENARLLLTSYLRSLASLCEQSEHSHDELIHLQHEVYVQTRDHFSNMLL
ncbi:Uncharacterized conserved protein (Neuroblastoma-amplified protein) [Plasmopara halstedii]|uniref:Uncharacterized conserved protein (Neuroblastoma-amplified protein) n=1 Tax=Plasmopara halstedii TaxID=4781 RepID=A0A0P1AFT9_PLAHL|nr:Uncharacterized conserved protein (Neuroblastoma-amplified protein) [Plasmopara halstedii]CEG39992.1 Uncharacterized conserved protein (Neuroblastoma-amplified protein) [Plasmopara halstedii]|eukprot:XP_024576361.1 Uncharacterized conserved protein (Neuroblastoma-amplified protein) [Plasmopara halstedii]